MRTIFTSIALVLAIAGCARQTASVTPAPTPVERGRYLVSISGCNDCHTPGYIMQNGKVEEQNWLVGDSMSWVGPWGTTYARNLRLYFQTMSEDQWLLAARTVEMRPPMPWFALRHMTDDDLRAIYQFVHSLGAAGEQAPAYLPPGTEAPLPRFKLELPPPPEAPPAAEAAH